VDLENQYYNSKALKEEEPKAALASFQKVLDLENGEKGEWGFKALKQMIKINFRLVREFSIGLYMCLTNVIFLQCNYDEMMVRYKQLLTYIKSAVTRNHSEKSINSILDYISTSKNVSIPKYCTLRGTVLYLPQFWRYNCLAVPCTLYFKLIFPICSSF